MQIRNFVRAQTKPYPGASSYIDDCKIKIWSVIPFDIEIKQEFETGVVVKIFNKNDILVKTQESFMLIDKYEPERESFQIKEGMQFIPENFSRQMNKIIKRHELEYPDLAVSGIIKNYE